MKHEANRRQYARLLKRLFLKGGYTLPQVQMDKQMAQQKTTGGQRIEKKEERRKYLG